MGERIVLLIKGVGATVGTVWSFIVGAMGWAFPTLAVMMLADFITGITAGAPEEGLSSKKGSRGFVKKVHIMIIVGIVYFLEKMIFGTQHIGDGVTLAYIVIEFISITENAGRIGVPLGPLKNFIAILKDKGEAR